MSEIGTQPNTTQTAAWSVDTHNMHQNDSSRIEPSVDLDALASVVLDAAIEVHRVLGPGFLEAIYEQAMCVELGLRGVTFVRQAPITVSYKDHVVGEARVDLFVSDRLIVELKAIDHLAPIHLAQALSYLKTTQLPLALLINFNVPLLLRGVRRVIHSHA